MFLTRTIHHPSIEPRKPPFQQLARELKVTPRTIQTIDAAPGCFLGVGGGALLLKIQLDMVTTFLWFSFHDSRKHYSDGQGQGEDATKQSFPAATPMNHDNDQCSKLHVRMQ